MEYLPVDEPTIVGVEFGPGAANQVGKIGMTIYNSNFAIKEARITAGISEHPSAPGTYQIIKTFPSANYPSDWIGSIVWDIDLANSNYLKKTQAISTKRTQVGIIVGGGSVGSGGSSWIHG